MGPGSKRKRTVASGQPPKSRHPAAAGASRATSSRAPTTQVPHPLLEQTTSAAAGRQLSSVSSVRPQPTVLKSAYRPPAKPTATLKWTRNPTMVTCNFQQITAWFDLDGTGQVATKESTKREVIELSSAQQFEKAGQPGFIGEGFTKRGIYVCPLYILTAKAKISRVHRLDLIMKNMLSPSHLTFRWARTR